MLMVAHVRTALDIYTREATDDSVRRSVVRPKAGTWRGKEVATVRHPAEVAPSHQRNNLMDRVENEIELAKDRKVD